MSKKTKPINIKKSFALLFLVMLLVEASGQNADQKWAIGLFGGKTEYKGDLGNGFLDFEPWFYGQVYIGPCGVEDPNMTSEGSVAEELRSLIFKDGAFSES